MNLTKDDLFIHAKECFGNCRTRLARQDVVPLIVDAHPECSLDQARAIVDACISQRVCIVHDDGTLSLALDAGE